MDDWNLATASVGDSIPELTIKPVKRSTLALYAGASGDHNPIHIDIDFARKAGMDDVFAHGMLVMAYLGRALTAAAPQSALREYSVQYSNMTMIGDSLTCRGEVISTAQADGEMLLTLAVSVVDQQGERKLKGKAVLARPLD